jgi:hypothetical protein
VLAAEVAALNPAAPGVDPGLVGVGRLTRSADINRSGAVKTVRAVVGRAITVNGAVLTINSLYTYKILFQLTSVRHAVLAVVSLEARSPAKRSALIKHRRRRDRDPLRVHAMIPLRSYISTVVVAAYIFSYSNKYNR